MFKRLILTCSEDDAREIEGLTSVTIESEVEIDDPTEDEETDDEDEDEEEETK